MANDDPREAFHVEAHAEIHRFVEYIFKLWAISIPTEALAIAGFGWSASATPLVRAILAMAATAFAVLFLGIELNCCSVTARTQDRIRLIRKIPEDRTIVVRPRLLAFVIWIKFLLLVALTWGIYAALPWREATTK